MRRWVVVTAVLVGMMALLACAAQEEAKPAPAAPAAAPAAPAAAPAAPAAKPAWEQEWERVLAAAKREGKVAVWGPPGTDVRRFLTEGFERKYGITVEYQGLRGGEGAARIKPERAAGQYLWDVHIGGTSTMLINLKTEGILDPFETAFILPEVKDTKSWRDGEYPFTDKDKRVFAMLTYATEAFYYNPNVVKAGDIKSYRDLLDPKWKGKIGMHDPTVPGSGDAKFSFLYVHKDLGPDFLRALAKQDILVTRNYEQLMEGVATGKLALSLGGDKNVALPMKKAGAPIDILPANKIKEGGSTHVGLGGISLINRAPHPNAAKVFINWLLSKEGQLAYTKAVDLPSNRTDIPTDHLAAWQLPRPGYIGLDSEDAVLNVRSKAREFARAIFGGR